MSLVSAISIPLQREIKPAGEFAGLFPVSTCAVTKLGNGKNNTHEGVEMMAEMVKKYSFQTEKVAEKLKASSLDQTIKNIYDFLYNHFQYWADGALQQLRSPACSWADRKKGIDCKSYSILAASICENLGITYSIRQVKQPGSYQNLWTHVYVVVPKNQKSDFKKQLNSGRYFILDGTKSNMEEVAFVEKEDKIMQSHQYVGMNAPVSRSVEKVASSLKLTAEGNRRLSLLSKKLNDLGFQKSQIENITGRIKQILQNGFPANKLYIFFLGGRLNVVSDKVEVFLPVLPKRLAVRGLNGSDDTDLNKKINEALKGIDWSSVRGFASNLWKKFKNLFSSSSYPESKVKKMLQNDLPGLLNYSGINGPQANLENINYFFWLSYGYWFNMKMTGQRLRSNSRANLHVGAKALKDFIFEVHRQVVQALDAKGIVLEGEKSIRILNIERNIPDNAGANAFPSVEICQIAGNGAGWNNDCGKADNPNFIGITHPISGKQWMNGKGGLSGQLNKYRQEDGDLQMLTSDRRFFAPRFTANRDFTFDGGFLDNIDVDHIIDQHFSSGRKINKEALINSALSKIGGSKNINDQLNSTISGGGGTSHAGMNWLLGIGLIGGAVVMMRKNKKLLKK